MVRSAIGLAILVLLAGACARRAPTAYAPGLGEIMTLTQMRHAKLWLAGEAGNWALAEYELHELDEGFEAVARFHPTHASAPRPLAELVPEFMDAPSAALGRAVAARDAAAFVAAYDGMTAACNGCHEATGFAFNVVVRPTANPYANQDFRAGP